MTRFIYDYTDGPKHQFNDYLSMDLDGKVHATWPISDHMYMDMDDGSLHMFMYDEYEERRRREKQRQREAHYTTNSGKAWDKQQAIIYCVVFVGIMLLGVVLSLSS